MTRYVAVGKESTYGADVAQTEYLDAIDLSVKPDNSIITDPSMGSRGLTKPQPGPFKVGSSFKGIVESENIGLLLLGLFGAGSDTPSTLETGVYKHTFTPQVSPQYLTVGGGSDVTAGQRTMPGFAVKKAKFSISPDARLLVEFDGFGKSLHLDALASPSFSTKQPFNNTHAVAKIATATNTQIQAMTVEIESKFGENDFTLGSRELRSAPLQGLSIKGSMDILFDQLGQLKMFLGSSIAAAPLTTLTKQRLDLNFTHDILAGATQYPQINFCLLETLYKIHTADIKTRDRTIEKLEFECYAPTAGAQMTLEYVNTIATY